jgi:hypothetical protein
MLASSEDWKIQAWKFLSIGHRGISEDRKRGMFYQLRFDAMASIFPPQRTENFCISKILAKKNLGRNKQKLDGVSLFILYRSLLMKSQIASLV